MEQATGGAATQAVGENKREFAPREILARSSEIYQQTKSAVTDACCKTGQTASQTYNHVMNYGRENPGKMTLIALGTGIGIGIVCGALGSRRIRIGRYAKPVIGTLAQMAMDFVKRR